MQHKTSTFKRACAFHTRRQWSLPSLWCTRKRAVIQTASVVHAFVYTFLIDRSAVRLASFSPHWSACSLFCPPCSPVSLTPPLQQGPVPPPLGNTVQGYHQFVRFTPSLPWWRGSPEHNSALRSTSSTHPLADP